MWRRFIFRARENAILDTEAAGSPFREVENAVSHDERGAVLEREARRGVRAGVPLALQIEECSRVRAEGTLACSHLGRAGESDGVLATGEIASIQGQCRPVLSGPGSAHGNGAHAALSRSGALLLKKGAV